MKKTILKKIDEYEKAIELRKENYNKILDEISVIDKKINIKDSYQQFIELIERKIEFWMKKHENIQIHLENCDFYAIFYAAYMSYATPFNCKKFIKIR